MNARRKNFTFCAIFIFSLLAVNLSAQWQEIGPSGGWITCMASLSEKPDKMVCGVLQGGAYFSENRGESWEIISEIGEYNPVYDVSISPDGTLFIASRNGLFAGRNLGSHWEKLSSAETWQVIALTDSVVAADTSKGSGWDSYKFHFMNEPWLISFDSGKDWQFWQGTVDSSIDWPDILNFHEKRGNMFVNKNGDIFRTEGLRIFKTQRGNWNEWEHVNDLDPQFYAWCRAFLIDADSIQYAFNEYYDFHPGGLVQGRVFKSEDSWQTWSRIPMITSTTALSVEVPFLFIGASDGITFNTEGRVIVYNTVVDTSHEIGRFGGDIISIDAKKWDAGELIVATESGIFRTSDFGLTWQNSSSGISRIHASAVQVLPIDGGSEKIVLAVHKGGIWSSEHFGNTWECENASAYVLPGLLSKSPGDSKYLYAGGFRFYRSMDSGSSWQQTDMYDFPADNYDWYGRFVDIAVDPFDPEHVFTHFDDHGMDNSHGIRCAESFDAGTSWIEHKWFSEERNYSCKAAFDSQTGRLWLSKKEEYESHPAFMVIDSTWENPVKTITLPEELVPTFWCVTGDTIYVMNVEKAKFLYSENLGETWFENDLGDFNDYYYWYDWAVNEQPGKLTLSPDGKSIFFVFPGTGILYSNDSGITWRNLNEGLPGLNVFDISFSTVNPDVVYLATENGFYQMDVISGISTVDEKEKSVVEPEEFVLCRSYPNPFNSIIHFNFTLNSSGKLVVSIYNILGREIEQIADGKFLTTGKYDMHWDASNYPSGIYVLKINFKNQIYVEKLLLIK